MLRSLTLIAALSAPFAMASPPAYEDDRSSTEAVVQSFYNAINRKEYLRAWSYFESSAAPAYATFKLGFTQTKAVDMKLGEVEAEGAAGSVQTKLPIAIQAHQSDGSRTVFEGCYILVQVNPSIQDTPPFRPIQIASAHLSESASDFDSVNLRCNLSH